MIKIKEQEMRKLMLKLIIFFCFLNFSSLSTFAKIVEIFASNPNFLSNLDSIYNNKQTIFNISNLVQLKDIAINFGV